MEQHPIIGFNYRISELHAAVGVAQARRVPEVIRLNRINKSLFASLLADMPGVSFSKLADSEGDSATFLNILLPDTESAKEVVRIMNEKGVAGFNYWYINMYHFINQWDHIKELKSASKLPIHLLGQSQDYKTLDLPKSQEVVGRLISFVVRCTWKEEEVRDLATRVRACMEEALTKTHA
jgi:8-amino-3,8-dideoxy-alpha-D-manno-octulosonate transaminase